MSGNRYPYAETESGAIIVNPGWVRDCSCRMNPCDVTWHYRDQWVENVSEYRWRPGVPYIRPPRTVK